MTRLKLSEHKKLMVEARGRRGDQSTYKSDLIGIHTRALKQKKLDIAKVDSVTSNLQPTSIPTFEESKTTSPKKMKTLMSEDIS